MPKRHRVGCMQTDPTKSGFTVSLDTSSSREARVQAYAGGSAAGPTGPEEPAGITGFRRPVDSLVDTDGQLRDLVHEVVIEQVAGLLGLPPESVDPMYRKYRH